MFVEKFWQRRKNQYIPTTTSRARVVSWVGPPGGTRPLSHHPLGRTLFAQYGNDEKSHPPPIIVQRIWHFGQTCGRGMSGISNIYTGPLVAGMSSARAGVARQRGAAHRARAQHRVHSRMAKALKWDVTSIGLVWAIVMLVACFQVHVKLQWNPLKAPLYSF